MTEFMDCSGSLRKIAGELIEQAAHVHDRPLEAGAYMEGAAFMLRWIADGLDKELELAARRANAQQVLRYLDEELF